MAKNTLRLLLALLPASLSAQYVFTPQEQISAPFVLYAGRAAVTGVLAYGGEAKTPNPDWEGKVVLVDRSADGTAYLIKLNNVKNSGGVGVVLANHVPGPFSPSIGVANPSTFTMVHVTKDEGELLRGQVGKVVTIGFSRPLPSAPDPVIPGVSVKTNNYTLTPDDVGDLVAMDATMPVAWTIPNETNNPFPDRSQIFGAMLGIGTVAIRGEDGVTIISIHSNPKAMYKGVKWDAIRLAPNKWLVSGSLEGDGAVFLKQRVVLSAHVTGETLTAVPPVFVWTKDGQVVSNNPSLHIESLSEADVGTYTVKVNTLTSSPVTMTLRQP